MKTNFTLIALLFFFLQINLSNAQEQARPVFKEATLSHPAELWKAFKLNEEGNNVLNGLHFYTVKVDCNSGKVKLLKLVNVNNYPVKFSYQMSPESPVITVMVPASVSIEGSCNTSDANLKNLVLPVPTEKNEQVMKNKEYMRAHISVSPL
jgi:hypothetical protein